VRRDAKRKVAATDGASDSTDAETEKSQKEHDDNCEDDASDDNDDDSEDDDENQRETKMTMKRKPKMMARKKKTTSIPIRPPRLQRLRPSAWLHGREWKEKAWAKERGSKYA